MILEQAAGGSTCYLLWTLFRLVSVQDNRNTGNNGETYWCDLCSRSGLYWKLSEKGTLPFQINCSWQSNTGIHSSLSLLCWWLSLSICNMPHIQIKILVLMLQCSVLSIDLNINMILTHANQVHLCAVLAASAVGLLVLPW